MLPLRLPRRPPQPQLFLLPPLLLQEVTALIPQLWLSEKLPTRPAPPVTDRMERD
jgi:hypothetical protein